MKDQDLETDKYGETPDEELLSLAFDCTEMVTELSKGYEMECQGDHESAMAAISSVEGRIDSWLDKLQELETDGVDKRKLYRGLEEAREAIGLDL